jgi:two-component system, chemotaxis family, CheB/CheR fusion protein
MNKRSVVVADDNKDAADSLAMLLELMGYAATAVYDGAQALEACRRHRPDLAILDVQMPILDGLAAARAIRAERGASVVLASMTGLRGRSERTGTPWDCFDAPLAKPLRMSELVTLLDQA